MVAAHLLVRRRAARGSLAREFASAVELTIGLVTVGVFAVALLMFISGHDAVVMSMLLLLAGGLTAYTTWLHAGTRSGGREPSLPYSNLTPAQHLPPDMKARPPMSRQLRITTAPSPPLSGGFGTVQKLAPR